MDPPGNGCTSRWWHFPHEADVGLAARAATLSELFRQMALALTAVVTDAQIRPTHATDLECPGSDPELLLVDWLNALICEMATQRVLFGEFDVEVGSSGVKARVRGETVDRLRHRPVVEPKGATYTGLSVARDADGMWLSRCVVDV